MRSILSVLVAVLALTCASCAPAMVDGLVFYEADGTARPLFAHKPAQAATLSLEGKKSSVLELNAPRTASSGQDLFLRVDTDGGLRLSLFAYKTDKEPILIVDLPSSLSGPREYRVPLAEGLVFQRFELELAGARSAALLELGMAERFAGYRSNGPAGMPVLSAGVVINEHGPSGVQVIEMDLGTGSDASLVASLGSPGTIRVRASKTVQASLAAEALVGLPLALLGGGRARVEADVPLELVSLEPGLGAPLSDLHAVLAAPYTEGDYALYRWDIAPDTLILDFADYERQDRYFKRLAFYAEKPGFRGRLASDDEIKKLHGWNAHDYSAATLASFYEKAREQAFPLSMEETLFLGELRRHGIVLISADGRIAEGRGAVISITREAPAWQRRTFIDHEATHALFFLDQEYRRLSERLWDGLGLVSRTFWLEHLKWRNYDVSHKYLCYNELQAYLMQQPLDGLAPYLGDNVLARMSVSYPSRAERYRDSREEILVEARALAEALDSYLRERWHVRAGALGRIRVLP